jgi:tellurite resistance protein
MLNVDMKPLVSAFLTKFGQSDEGLTAAIDLAVLVAIADGTIDKAERAALDESIAAIMGGAVAAPVARHLVGESKRQIAAEGIQPRAQAIGASLAKHGAVAEGLRLALAVAYASDGLSEEERARIGSVAAAANAPSELLDELVRSMKPA